MCATMAGKPCSPKTQNPRADKPAGSVLQITVHDKAVGNTKQPTNRPTEYRCYIKEGIQYATAGAVTPSWKAFLRPLGNSPSQQHLTQGLLLCSGILYMI